MFGFINGRIIDGNTPEIRTTDIYVANGMIVGLGEAPKGYDGWTTHDLGGKYVIPGLFDVHVHPTLKIPDPYKTSMFETVPELTLRGAVECMSVLQHGYTSLRVVGEAAYIDVALKKAFETGLLTGPRLFVCGHILKPTGGHGSMGNVRPVNNPGLAVDVDGPDAVRKAAREQIENGADQLKLAITGGIAGDREKMADSLMTPEEIRAACDVAHRKGIKVCAHVSSALAAKVAIENGVDSIEHGYALDEEVVALMAARGTYLVPTLSVTQNESFMISNNWPGYMREKALSSAKMHRKSFQMALAAGVPIAKGTDLNPFSEALPGELELLVEAGGSLWQALQMATINAAKLCDVSDKLGTLEVGKLADMVILEENPLEHVKAYRTVVTVYKEGTQVYQRPGVKA